jgi:hypothetical protein
MAATPGPSAQNSVERNTVASGTAVGSNVEIVREYTERVFNAHAPERASEYVAPDVKWHGVGPGRCLPAQGRKEHRRVAADDPTAILHQVGACTPPWLS